MMNIPVMMSIAITLIVDGFISNEPVMSDETILPSAARNPSKPKRAAMCMPIFSLSGFRATRDPSRVGRPVTAGIRAVRLFIPVPR